MQDQVGEQVAHHVTMSQYSRPVEHFNAEIGAGETRLYRLVDSGGLVEECVAFESRAEPNGPWA